MQQNSLPEKPLVLSYLGLRKAVGIIGLALPFVLAIGKLLTDGPGILNSISSYYYSGMRNVFVGSLCAIGMFLMSYKGYERKDDIAGDLACMFVIGTALFPPAPGLNPTSQERFIGALHLVFAASFFITLTYFSLFLFRKTDLQKGPTRRKLQRNSVYAVCGYTMLCALVLIVLVKQLPGDSALMKLDPVFWLESLAVVAFGMSWLTRGEALIKDET